MTPNDLVRLRHILDAAEAAIADLRGRSREDLDLAPWLTRSVLQCLQVIGEAATRVGAEARESLPELPWADMVAMRNGWFTRTGTWTWTSCGVRWWRTCQP